jgi:hypothetical protein
MKLFKNLRFLWKYDLQACFTQVRQEQWDISKRLAQDIAAQKCTYDQFLDRADAALRKRLQDEKPHDLWNRQNALASQVSRLEALVLILREELYAKEEGEAANATVREPELQVRAAAAAVETEEVLQRPMRHGEHQVPQTYNRTVRPVPAQAGSAQGYHGRTWRGDGVDAVAGQGEAVQHKVQPVVHSAVYEGASETGRGQGSKEEPQGVCPDGAVGGSEPCA